MSFDNLKMSAGTATLALAGAFLSVGCGTIPGGPTGALPNYGSTQAPARAANTTVDPNGIRYNPDGTPMAVHYNACSELNRTIAATRPSGRTDRAVTQGAGAIGGAIASKRGNVGGVAAGVGIGIGGQILGDQVNQQVNNARVAQLEADCNQQRAHEDFRRSQNSRYRPQYNR